MTAEEIKAARLQPITIELPIGVAWWLYHEVQRAHADEKHNLWSPLSDLKYELQHALQAGDS